MAVINGDTGIDKVQDGSIVDADLNLSVKPMFSAYQSVAQSFTASVQQVVNFQTEEFDLTNAYDTTTMRFTPQKAGYYQVNANISFPTAGTNWLSIRKNGATLISSSSGTTIYTAVAFCVVYMNGTTDYLDVVGNTSLTQSANAGSFATKFQAHYIGA